MGNFDDAVRRTIVIVTLVHITCGATIDGRRDKRQELTLHCPTCRRQVQRSECNPPETP